MLRGEGLDALARETGRAAGTMAGWREDFLQAGHEGLKARPAPIEDCRLADAQRKIGELAMDLDRQARIRRFARGFNQHWLLERHGYRTPAQARQTLRQTGMT